MKSLSPSLTLDRGQNKLQVKLVRVERDVSGYGFFCEVEVEEEDQKKGRNGRSWYGEKEQFLSRTDWLGRDQRRRWSVWQTNQFMIEEEERLLLGIPWRSIEYYPSISVFWFDFSAWPWTGIYIYICIYPLIIISQFSWKKLLLWLI